VALHEVCSKTFDCGKLHQEVPETVYTTDNYMQPDRTTYRLSIRALALFLFAFGHCASVAQTAANCPFNLDQSSAGSVRRATTDGLLFIRYALNLPSTTPPVSRATENASLTSAQVAAHMSTNAIALDIDGDNVFSAFDAQVIARYLLGFRGANLAIDLPEREFAKRFTGEEYQQYIDNGCTALVGSDPRIQVWNAMNAALVANNAALAKTFLTGNANENHGPVFDALIAEMPTIIASYSELVPRYAGGNYAEYWLSRPVAGSTTGDRYVHIVIFMRDPGNGLWKIDSM
jgi:hypothetical protein